MQVEDTYIETNIVIDGSPLNRLQVYTLLERRGIDDSKNNMRKGRPCVVVQEGEIGKFYGDTKLIVIPLTKVEYVKDKNGKFIKKVKNYTVDFLGAFVVEVKAEKVSDCLVYNYVTRVESELKKWYTKDTYEEVFISLKEKIKILRVLEEYLMETVKIEVKALGRKTVYQELKESHDSLERSNKELRESHASLKTSYTSLERSYEGVKESNRKLEESNKGLENKVIELEGQVNKLVKLLEEKLG